MKRSLIDYTPAIADCICAELGRKLCEICRDDGMPSMGTVHGWVRRNLSGFGDRYRGYPHPRGIPSRYTRVLAKRIYDGLCTGRTLLDICSEPGMPSDRAVRDWVARDRDGFAARFYQARDFGYLSIADEMMEIADDGRNDWMERGAASGKVRFVFNRENVARSRVRLMARCWLLSKMLPRRLGNTFSLSAQPETDDRPSGVAKFIAARNGTPPPGDGAGDSSPERLHAAARIVASRCPKPREPETNSAS